MPAVIAMCLLSICYLFTNNIYDLINYVGFATWLAIGLAVVCVPYLRWKQPDLPRPIKVNLIWPYIYILGSIFITVVPMIADPVSTLKGTGMILSGVPVYAIFIWWEKKPDFMLKMSGKLTEFLQRLMVVIPSEKKDKV